MGYDINGRCTDCGEYHPCNCETNTDHAYDNGSEQADELEAQMEHNLDRYLTWYNEERD